MKTYLLRVPDEANDPAVHAALADLLARQLIVLQSDEAAIGSPLLSNAEIEHDVLLARQQPGISLQEARARFGL